MYQKITTEGIVLRKSGSGEASVRVAVLTEELGLVVASARSARSYASKLRYGLEPLTKARFCFVRGAHEWRVAEVHTPHQLALVPTARATMGRVAQLLLRLIHGQEPNSNLYKDVSEGFNLLRASGKTSNGESIEVVLVLRILSHLGYLPRTEALAPFVDNELSLELSAKALESRSLLIKTINESLHASGL